MKSRRNLRIFDARKNSAGEVYRCFVVRNCYLSHRMIILVRAIKFIVRATPALCTRVSRQPSPFIRDNLYLRPSTIIQNSSKKGETIGRDVCRRSLRRSSSQTGGNFNRFFFPPSLSLSLPRDLSPSLREAHSPPFFIHRFLQSVLSIPVKALTGLATTLFATQEIRVSQE